MAFWDGLGDIENDISAIDFSTAPSVFTPGDYSWTGTYAEAAHPDNTYASRMSIIDPDAPLSFASSLIGLHGSISPGGDTEEHHGTFTIVDDGGGFGHISATTGDVAVRVGSDGRIDFSKQYHMIGSTAGPHHPKPHKTTGMAFSIDGGTTPPPPPPPPGDQQDVVDDDDVFIDTLVNIADKVIRIERQGWGSGSFTMRRDATDAPLIGTGQDGRMVKVTIPRISADPIFRYMIETIETVVVDQKEQGGELISVAGRGALAYIGRAVSSPFTYVIPSGPVEVHRGPAATGQKAGQVLRRAIAEYQHVDRPQHPIPLITVDFDYTNDSNGDLWDTTDATAEMAIGYTGENALVGMQELWGTGGIDMMLKPDGSMLLQAFNYYGRDLTGTSFGAGVVRFVKGVNIADTLKRTRGTQLPTTYMWVEGDDLTFIDPPRSLASAGSRPVVEGFLKTIGTSTPFLDAVGDSALIEALRRGESVAFNVAIVKDNDLLDEDAGLYLPGPPGTNGNFWIGDTVTVSTGSGVDDFENEDARIEAITISFDPGNNLRCKVELKATTILGRIGAIAGTPGTFNGVGGNGVGPGSSSGAGGTPIPPPPTSSQLLDHETDPTDAHDASAISFFPTGTIASTDVQNALQEVASEAIQASVLTTQDDIIVRGASAPARLGKGSDGQVLTVDPTTHHLVWATPSAGSAITVKDEGTPLATDASSLDFVGAGVTASGTGAAKTITIPGASAITIKDEGTPLATDATSIDFVGAGVTASGSGAAKTVTVPIPAHSALSGLTSGDDHTQYVENADDVGIAINIDNGSVLIPTGIKAAFKMPRAGHFRASPAIVAPRDATSSAVFDIWVRNGSAPTVSQSITASAKPTLTTSQFNDTASTLSGWTTAFGAGDWVYINLDSVTNATMLILYLPIDWT